MTGLNIDAKEGEAIQIGQSTVVVNRARNGKLSVRVTAPPDVDIRRPVRGVKNSLTVRPKTAQLASQR